MTADLRAIAEAATPAPWGFDAGDETHEATVETAVGSFRMGRTNRYADAAHIAAWSPDRALAALDVIETARGLAESVERWNESVTAVIGRAPKTGMGTDAFRAALDRWDALNA